MHEIFCCLMGPNEMLHNCREVIRKKQTVFAFLWDLYTFSPPKKKLTNQPFKANIADSVTSRLSLNFSGKCGGRSLTLCVKRMGFSSSIPGRWSREVLYQLEVGSLGKMVPPLVNHNGNGNGPPPILGFLIIRHFLKNVAKMGCRGNAACCC